MKILTLLNRRSRWTKGVYARSALGNPVVGPLSPRAVCWCISGGAAKCYPDVSERFEVKERIRQAIAKLFPSFGDNPCIVAFNDNPKIKLADVRRVLRTANA